MQKGAGKLEIIYVFIGSMHTPSLGIICLKYFKNSDPNAYLFHFALRDFLENCMNTQYKFSLCASMEGENTRYYLCIL